MSPRTRQAIAAVFVAIVAITAWRLLSGEPTSPPPITFGAGADRPKHEAVVYAPPATAEPSRPPMEAAPFVERKETHVFVVRNEEGSPLPGAQVLFVSSRVRRLTPGSFRAVGSADRDGRVVVNENWDENVVAAAMLEGRMSAPATRPDEHGGAPIPLVVKNGFALTVNLKDERGAPVAGVLVTAGLRTQSFVDADQSPRPLGPLSPFAAASELSDGGGRAVFRSLPAGTWFLSVESVGYVALMSETLSVEIEGDRTFDVVIRPVYAVVASLDESVKGALSFAWNEVSPGAMSHGPSYVNLNRRRHALGLKFPNVDFVSVVSPDPDPADLSEPAYETTIDLILADGPPEKHVVRYRRADRITAPEVIRSRAPSNVLRHASLVIELGTPSGRIIDGVEMQLNWIAGSNVQFPRFMENAGRGEPPILRPRASSPQISGTPIEAFPGTYTVALNSMSGFLPDLASASVCYLAPAEAFVHTADGTRVKARTTFEVSPVHVVFKSPIDEAISNGVFISTTNGERTWSGRVDFDKVKVLPLPPGPWRMKWGGSFLEPGETEFRVEAGAPPIELQLRPTLAP